MGFPCGSAGKESAGKDLGLIPGLERSPGEGKDYPLQYSGLENSMDYIVLGVTKSWTHLSNFHFSLRVNSKVAVKGEKARDYYFFSWSLVALQCSVNFTTFMVGFPGGPVVKK